VPAENPWTPFAPVAGLPPLTPAVLAEILDGGQAFRWHREPDENVGGVPSLSAVALAKAEPNSDSASGSGSVSETFLGQWSDNVARLRLATDGTLEFSTPAALAPRVVRELPRYLAADRDWPALADSLPWRSDAHLAKCLAAFPGLRILRQPFGETLLGFLCSATKQIVQIKQMLALLSSRHGVPVVERVDPNALSDATANASQRVEVNPLHQLPTWETLAAIPETELRACQLGFRARYISETARFLAAHPGWLDETETLPYPAAKARLLGLPGVGEKIADCVLLFGAGRLEAFPVDTWILQAMAARYGLTGWKPAQVAQFGRAHFGPLAGLAQQFLFAHERRAARG
jgi:N-glycosylase/DNA lyase